MASPLGHSLVGFAAAWALSRRREQVTIRSGAAIVFFANLPDVDYLPGLATGSLNAFHQGFTHSVAFAILALPLGAVLAPWLGRSRWDGALLACLLCLSHLLVDFLTADLRPPIGMPLLWPMSRETFNSPVSLALPMEKPSLSGIFTPWNLWVSLVEAVTFAPLAAISWRSLRKRLKEA